MGQGKDKEVLHLVEGTDPELTPDKVRELHEKAGWEWMGVRKEIDAGSADVRALMIVARNSGNGEVQFDVNSTCDTNLWWELLQMMFKADPDMLVELIRDAGMVAVKLDGDAKQRLMDVLRRRGSGIKIPSSAEDCNDPECPIHGSAASKTPKYQA